MRTALLTVGLAALALAAEPTAQQLFERVREKVVENVRRMPRYTCVQTIDRSEYHPQFRQKARTCAEVFAERRNLAGTGSVVWRDRLRLEVSVVNGVETFSWAGARRFETSDISQLTESGSSGSGDFSSFLRTVFAGKTVRVSLAGEEHNPAGVFSTFAFSVPVEGSGYLYRSHTGGEKTAPYHGTFLVDAGNADLKRLTVIADQFPADEQMCRVDDVMDYHRLKIGEGDFLLPETSKMTVLFNDGREARNETHYSACREYVGESTISFGDADTAASVASLFSNSGGTTAKAVDKKEATAATDELPPDVRLQIGLNSPVRTETASAGDVVDGVVLRDARDAVLGVVASKGDIVHGRILRLEQFTTPAPRWIVAIRFDMLEHKGIRQPLHLRPRDDGDRSSRGKRTFPPNARPAGAGVFMFAQPGALVLDESFRSEWETQ